MRRRLISDGRDGRVLHRASPRGAGRDDLLGSPTANPRRVRRSSRWRTSPATREAVRLTAVRGSDSGGCGRSRMWSPDLRLSSLGGDALGNAAVARALARSRGSGRTCQAAAWHTVLTSLGVTGVEPRGDPRLALRRAQLLDRHERSALPSWLPSPRLGKPHNPSRYRERIRRNCD